MPELDVEHMSCGTVDIVRDHHDTMIDCLEQISTINVRIDFIIEK